MHRTHIGVDSHMLAMPAEMAREVMGVETFQRVRSLVVAPEHENDLFAGLR